MSNRKKLEQPINPLFEPDQKKWDEREKKIIDILKKEIEKNVNEEKKLPHKRSIEDIIIDVREMSFKLIDFANKRQNPIKYILLNERNQFSFCVIIILIGVLLLLISNLVS